MTRTQVARRLGVSVTTVRRMEGKELFPERDERGVWRFVESQLAAVARRGQRAGSDGPRSQRRSRGETAARVFEMFEEGFDLRVIVPEAEVSPSVVRKLYQEWLVSLQDGERLRRDRAAESDRKEHDREFEKWAEVLRR